MLKKLLNLEQNFTVSKAAIIVGFFTFLAKLVALVRDPLFAAKIGAGDKLDIYFAAFRIPDFVFNLLVLGTLSVALIPIFAKHFVDDRTRANRIASSVLNISVLAMSFICFLLFLFSQPLTKFLVPGFNGEKLLRTVQLMRLFLLSPIIFTASNIFTSYLTASKKFLVLSVAPIMYNLGIIFGLFFFYPHFGLLGLGYGVILGAVCHMLVQIPEAVRFGFRWQALIDFREPALKKIAKLFVPRIIGMDISQISIIVGTTVGSILAAGSVSIFNLANNLQAAPLGIFALSVSAASFPQLSEHFAKGDNKAFVKTLANSVMMVLFFIIPITILMLIFRVFTVEILYGHGKFTPSDTRLMFTTFGILTLSLIGQSLSPLFSRSFYARQNTIIPVIVNLCSIIIDIILAYVLGIKFGLAGIASGFAIACVLDGLLMFIFLRRYLRKDNISLEDFDSELGKFLVKILIASLIMGLVGFAGIFTFAPLVNTKTTLGIVIQSALAISLALLAFLAVSYKLGLQQTKRILGIVRKIF